MVRWPACQVKVCEGPSTTTWKLSNPTPFSDRISRVTSRIVFLNGLGSVTIWEREKKIKTRTHLMQNYTALYEEQVIASCHLNILKHDPNYSHTQSSSRHIWTSSLPCSTALQQKLMVVGVDRAFQRVQPATHLSAVSWVTHVPTHLP